MWLFLLVGYFFRSCFLPIFFLYNFFFYESFANASRIDSSHSLLLDSIASSQEWKKLLHYGSARSLIRKDSNFFLSPVGPKDAKAELIATLVAFGIESNERNTTKPQNIKSHSKHNRDSKAPPTTQSDSINPSNALCRYPARALFLSRFFPQLNMAIETTHCDGYEEFLSIVPDDSISIIFAAESDIYLGSAMGHIFLALEGYAKEDIDKTFEGKSDLHIKKGEYIGYSLSFFANSNLGLNPIPYIKAFVGKLQGIYALQPLSNNTFEYIENEKRSLWKLQLKLSKESKKLLLAHIWELKDTPLDYAFITHNCNDALRNILALANKAFDIKDSKIYQTPTEYLKELHNRGLIQDISVEIPKQKLAFTKKYGYNEILQTRNSAKLALEYENRVGASLLSLYFSPIYSDITNANNAYKEITEMRLLSMKGSINLSDNRAFIDKIEALHLFSIPDFYRTKNIVKYIDISFENPFDERHSTRLYPRISFGAGLGAYIGNISVYMLPIVGYDYVSKHNAFINFRFGIVGNFHRVRLLGSYDYFFDIANQRGYKQQVEAFLGVNIYKQVDVYARLVWRDSMQYGNYVGLQGGISFHF